VPLFSCCVFVYFHRLHNCFQREAELPCLWHSCVIMCAQSKAVLLQRIKAVVHLHKMQTVQAGGAHQPSLRESQLFNTACEGARQQAILNDTRCTFISFRKFLLDSSEYLPTVSLHFAHHRPISRAPRMKPLSDWEDLGLALLCSRITLYLEQAALLTLRALGSLDLGSLDLGICCYVVSGPRMLDSTLYMPS